MEPTVSEANQKRKLVVRLNPTYFYCTIFGLRDHDTCRTHLSAPNYRTCPYAHVICPVNTSGIPRLTKFYTPLHQAQQTIVQKIFSLISSRPPGLCNFLDAPELEAFLGPQDEKDERWRVVYRSYATLYFVFVVDGAESELGILDLIQVCRPIETHHIIR